MEIRWNKNEDARTSPVRQELKSIPVDWAVGLHRNRDELTLWWESSIYLTTLLDAPNSAAARASRDEAFVVKDTVTFHVSPACVLRNQCQPIWAFSVGTAKARWFLRNRDAGWGKTSCYDVIKMVVSYSSAWSSFTYKIVPAKRVDLWTTAALVRNTKFQS